jgi:hypothetical protein
LSGVWFRGVSDANWNLETTLERRNAKSFSVAEYYELARRIKPEVEAFTKAKWDVPDWCEPENNFARHFSTMPAFGYIAHLRHHGFPSPLLDWSRSPYVAAYFAFARAGQADMPCCQPRNGESRIAIYVFSETPNNYKDRQMSNLCSHGGRNLTTDARHFRQQSSYTVCVQFCDSEQRWKFVPHQRVFDLGKTDQDCLYKITVPATERTEVLKLLSKFNLNAFTLFGSEESLMDAMAFQEIDLK